MRKVIIGLVLLSVVACGGGSPSAPSPLNVSGTWTGTVTDQFGQAPAQVSLTQSGTALTGTWIAGPNGGRLSGTLSDTSLSATLEPSDPSTCPYTLNATVTGGNRITGTYAAFNCTQQINGTIALTKQ